MNEPQPNPRISCLSLALLVVVAAAVVIAFGLGYLGPRASSWSAIGAAALAAVAVFIIERRLKNFFWAGMAVLVLAVHPQARQPVKDQIELLAQSGVLAGLAAVAVGWQLAFHRGFAWRLWPLVGGAVVASVGLTWVADASLGLVAALLIGLSMLPAAVLARYRRLRVDAVIPSRLNVLTALAVALVAPAAGIYLCRLLDLSAGELRLEGSLRDAWQGFLDQPADGLTLARLNLWCWPTAWVMLPILAWGWWRSLRRGWRDWRAGQPPTAWWLTVLTVLAAVALAPRPAAAPLVLVGLAVVLLVWWVADVWRGAVEQLILLPPEAERGPLEPAPETTSAPPPPEPAPANSEVETPPVADQPVAQG